MTILYFLIALSILVAAHEWGHFIVAKLSGIGVETFSIGFGPKILAFKRGETEYCFSIIPLGGYVKMVGEDPQDESASKYPPEKSFANKPARARLATVLAGPTMNLIMAALLLPLVFVVGKKEIKVLQEAPVISAVLSHSPAETSGLVSGDRIEKIDGHAVDTWQSALEQIAVRPNQTVSIELVHNNAPLEKTITIATDPYATAPVGFLGVEPQYVLNNEPIIGKVFPDTPAAKAGLIEGDRILSIDNHKISFWSDIVDAVSASEGKPLNISVLHDQHMLHPAVVTPAPQPNSPSKWMIGIAKQESSTPTIVHRYPLKDAIRKGGEEFKKLTLLTVDVLKRLLSLQLSYKSLGGPIQIAAASGAAAKSGLGDFLYFMAFLSLQLGILNLLPIPVLDGGHVAFMAIEGVIRRPLPISVKTFLLRAGLVLLLGLMLLVTLHDATSLWGNALQKFWMTVQGWFHR